MVTRRQCTHPRLSSLYQLLHPFLAERGTDPLRCGGSTSFVTGGSPGMYLRVSPTAFVSVVDGRLTYLYRVALQSFCSRLLVRLAGLWTLAVTGIFMAKMIRVSPGPFKHHKQKLMEKNAFRAVRIVKKLGQGGPMKYFLNFVHPFTRTLRIVVAAWRWIEAAQCRRGEVGTEEAMVRSTLGWSNES